MDIIEIQTLVDITETGQIRPNREFVREHDQHRNFVTLKQCLELRSIITYQTSPVMEIIDLKNLSFGSTFKGKHKIWTFRFTTDRSGVYNNGISEIGCLIDDLHEVPVIQNLTESVNILKPIFDLKNLETKNTLVKAIKGTI